jgi:hypothetical protein
MPSAPDTGAGQSGAVTGRAGISRRQCRLAGLRASCVAGLLAVGVAVGPTLGIGIYTVATGQGSRPARPVRLARTVAGQFSSAVDALAPAPPPTCGIPGLGGLRRFLATPLPRLACSRSARTGAPLPWASTTATSTCGTQRTGDDQPAPSAEEDVAGVDGRCRSGRYRGPRGPGRDRYERPELGRRPKRVQTSPGHQVNDGKVRRA